MARILLTDDEDMVRESLGTILRSAGHEVVETTDGLEAERALAEAPFDLFLTDLIMPGQEGVQTIINMRKVYPELLIVAISGGGRLGGDTYLLSAKHLGADAVLSKPFRAKAILALVESLLTDGPGGD